MSEILIETTTCYKCQVEMKAEVGQVHPLCAECQDEHDSWFESQLGMFK